MLHKVSIEGMTIDPKSKTPVIVLKSEKDGRSIPIWIGLFEATSIASSMKNMKFDRPMTHDLFKNLTSILNIKVAKVEVCDLIDDVFYARIYFVSKENTFSMDARPSDAIAIALRFDAPIYVEEKVISQPEQVKAEPFDKSEEGKKWTEYLEKFSSEDFGKYKV
jgi:hypothetical protein